MTHSAGSVQGHSPFALPSTHVARHHVRKASRVFLGRDMRAPRAILRRLAVAPANLVRAFFPTVATDTALAFPTRPSCPRCCRVKTLDPRNSNGSNLHKFCPQTLRIGLRTAVARV